MPRVDRNGGYMEIDTLEDASLAERWWAETLIRSGATAPP
jgi:hypothetical protein